MNTLRSIHEDFRYYLDLKEADLIALYVDLRNYILDIHPQCNELIYHTHALTSVYTLSEKLTDAFCMIPIYNNHLNLGFNKGTLLKDPKKLLQGTGKYIRHIPINKVPDFRNNDVSALIHEAVLLSKNDMNTSPKLTSETISKIKKS